MSLARGGNLRANRLQRHPGEGASTTPYQTMVNEMVLRSQSQADLQRRKTIGHFGLNLMHYAHFTSPIRRYADLIVHRAWSARSGSAKAA